MDEAAKAMIDRYLAKLAPIEAEGKKYKTAINLVCEMEGEPPMFELGQDIQAATPAAVRSDQYFGRGLATVAREVLEDRYKRGLGSIPPDELYAILTKGGHDFEGKDDMNKKRGMLITLGKNPAFIRVPGSGDVGLSERYPNAKKKKKDSGNGNGDKDEADDTTDSPAAPQPAVTAQEAAPEASQRAPGLFSASE